MTTRILQRLLKVFLYIRSAWIPTRQLLIINTQRLVHDPVIVELHHIESTARILPATTATASSQNRVAQLTIPIRGAAIASLLVIVSVCTHNLLAVQIL